MTPLPELGSVHHAELVVVELPLVRPFRTAYGEHRRRVSVLVHVGADDVEGWGECVALETPHYSPEFAEAAALVIERVLWPAVGPDIGSAAAVAPRLATIQGHPMAKAAIEMALLDAQLRLAERSLATHLGGAAATVPAGVSLGMAPRQALLDRIETCRAEGYHRVKLKTEPGHAVDLMTAVRDRFGAELPVQLDANGAYDPGNPTHLAELAALDQFGLLMLEQPFSPDELVAHARLAERVSTPICLDEPIVSEATLRQALDLGACSVVNLKPGRVGGYLTARDLQDRCRERSVDLWCGGMLETGLARAANLALASLPGFTLTGDLSPTSRYYDVDLTEPVELDDEGHLAVPTGPGIGVAPDAGVLAEVATHRLALTD